MKDLFVALAITCALASCAYIDAATTQYVAKMGGNAVFVVRDVLHPDLGRKLIAVAIRYR